MRILIVEDESRHQQEALAVAKELSLSVSLVKNAYEAIDLIRKKQVDALVIDLYLPLSDTDHSHADSPCGLLVGAHAKMDNLPFVFCTSGYHHGAKYEWIEQFTRGMDWPRMIDSGSPDGEAKSKLWEVAFKQLLEATKQ